MPWAFSRKRERRTAAHLRRDRRGDRCLRILGSRDLARRGNGDVGRLYRDRGMTKTSFDELKNQWGGGGFTTQRCRLAARMLALFYDWWNIFVRLADPNLHREAITSRPLFLSAIATRTRHARQTTIRVTSSHARPDRPLASNPKAQRPTADFRILHKALRRVGKRSRRDARCENRRGIDRRSRAMLSQARGTCPLGGARTSLCQPAAAAGTGQDATGTDQEC